MSFFDHKPLFAPWLGLAMAGCAAASATPDAPPPPYRAIASGRIDAAGDARRLVAERDGIIADVLVTEGDTVDSGQPLVRLACADLVDAAAAADAAAEAAAADARLVTAGPRQEDITAAAARADEAEIRNLDARDALNRASALQAQGFVSARRLAELKAEAAAREAAWSAARADVARLDAGARSDERRRAAAVERQRRATAAQVHAEAAKCDVHSPTAGTVLRIFRHAGEFSGASRGDPLIVVGNLQQLVVRAEFVEGDAGLVRPGAAVDVWIDGDARRWRGRIVSTAALMGRRTARSTDPAERFDSDVLEAVVGFDGGRPPALVGLRVNVGLTG